MLGSFADILGSSTDILGSLANILCIFGGKVAVGLCVTTMDTQKILNMGKIKSYLLNIEAITPSDAVSDYYLICI